MFVMIKFYLSFSKLLELEEFVLPAYPTHLKEVVSLMSLSIVVTERLAPRLGLLLLRLNKELVWLRYKELSVLNNYIQYRIVIVLLSVSRSLSR